MPDKTPPQLPQNYKVRPQSSTPSGSASALLLLVGLGGLLLIAIGAAIALANNPSPNPTPTLIPAPTLSSGARLVPQMIVYALEPSNFRYAAATELENADQGVLRCDELRVSTQGSSSDYFFYDSGNSGFDYWVYAVQTDESGSNGWLPLANVSDSLPADCPAD